MEISKLDGKGRVVKSTKVEKRFGGQFSGKMFLNKNRTEAMLLYDYETLNEAKLARKKAQINAKIRYDKQKITNKQKEIKKKMKKYLKQ